jgi:hypothetical protein
VTDPGILESYRQAHRRLTGWLWLAWFAVGAHGAVVLYGLYDRAWLMTVAAVPVWLWLRVVFDVEDKRAELEARRSYLLRRPLP